MDQQGSKFSVGWK